ncbi:MAG TPA: aminotransferase class III-fold pyridoxal phosphate-dependent enzyme [Kofleriaceae bacterium]|jgi:glutamate-1-semialdehyde 2,1-aminomutase|nr:aminotransferase class III-fold pyridoxal phosphate-dependent enzyme [Kofleriaceae bacterium]
MSLLDRAIARLRLSRAKHRSLHGHAKLALRLSRLMPFYEYNEASFFATDGAPADVVTSRHDGFMRLSQLLTSRAPRTLAMSQELEDSLSDVAFINAYRVPFQFRRLVADKLKVGCVVAETDGERVADLDGNWAYDLGGSYGVNLFGNEFYKRCIERGVARAGQLGLVLGAYHPVIADNVRRLREISGMDEVTFHMSGTEAVMQAVRLARYHTGRSHIVRFCGAYHGWWDGVQAGVGNPRPAHEVYTLKEMDAATLRVLETRDDIACVLVNPIQAMHPNGAPASDSTLVASDRTARYDKVAYAHWLRQLRDVCTRRGIVLVFDEVFLGFRLARGGVQEYFDVRADMVTYGKSLGGGLPVGVVCGKRACMRRFRDDRPSDVCFARGTFNSHPYVMATMNEFLRALDEPEIARTYDGLDERWDGRAEALNRRLAALELPVRVANMTSVMTTLYLVPSRYNWMFQFYLRAEGLALSWIGTGRFIFSHDTSDATFQAVSDRFIAAASAMRRDGFWWHAAELTNRSIKRRVLRELVSAGLARRASGPAIRL